MLISLIGIFVISVLMILGCISVFYIKKDKAFVCINAISYGVLVALIILKLIPNALYSFSDYVFIKQIGLTIFITISGVLLYQIVDNLILNHHTLENEKTVYHVSLMTFIGLVIYGFINGMMLYKALSNSFSLASIIKEVPIMIILTMMISYMFYYMNPNKKKVIRISIILGLDFLMGGLLMAIFSINGLIISLLELIMVGMLLSIMIDELFYKIFKNNYQLESLIGILGGMGLVTILVLL